MPHTYLASDRPDLVERWETTEDQYYARHQDKTVESMRRGPLDQEYVCDRYGSFAFLPVVGPVDHILTRQSFEHLSIGEAHNALENIGRVLRQNGMLTIDVPDHDESLRLYKETGDDFYKRHLLGPRRNDYGYHLMSYTRERLTRLVEEHGFAFYDELDNIHCYPAFCIQFWKV